MKKKMLLWNAKHVRPPPISSVLRNREELDFDKLESVCSQAVSVLDSQKQLHMEAALLSRVLYRMKSKYHQNIGFKHLEKVNRGLLQYLSLDLFGVYSTFTGLVSGGSRDPKVYLPTRQMLEWVLVRTQGFARLFCFIAQECREAARHFHSLITLGHTWETALLCMGLASRVWSVAKYLVTSSCHWYAELKPFLTAFKTTGRHWLPTGYEFPEDLIKWLDAPWLTDQQINKSKPKTAMERVLSRLVDDEEEDDQDILADSNSNIVNLITEKLDIDEISGRNVLDKRLVQTKEQVVVSANQSLKNMEATYFEDPDVVSSTQQSKLNVDLGEKISRSSLKRMMMDSLGPEVSIPQKKFKTTTGVNVPVKPITEKASEKLPQLRNGIAKEKEDSGSEVEIVNSDSAEGEKASSDSEDVQVIIPDLPKEKFVEHREENNSKTQKPAKEMHSTVCLYSNSEEHISRNKKNSVSLSSLPNSLAKRKKSYQDPQAGSSDNKILRKGKTKTTKSVSFKLDEQGLSSDRDDSGSTTKQEARFPSPKFTTKQIDSLQTHHDLEMFIKKESKLREMCSKKSVTQGMDKLQWHMICNVISSYVQKLYKSSVTGDQGRYEKLMKKAKKAIKLRIL